MGGTPSIQTRNYGQESYDTLMQQVMLAPQLYASEAQFQPLYTQLGLQKMQDTLLGTQGSTQQVPTGLKQVKQEGWYGKGGEYLGNKKTLGDNYVPPEGATYANKKGMVPTGQYETRTIGAQRGLLDIYEKDINPMQTRMNNAAQSAQRAADIGDVEKYGLQASEAFMNANPQLKAQLNYATALQANPLYDSVQNLDYTGRLTPQELAQGEQQTRASYAARGMGLSDQAVSAEVQNRLINQQQKMMQNMQIGGQVMNQQQNYALALAAMRQQTASDPFMAILGRPSTATQQGQQMGGQALGMGQNFGPSLFNPESSYANNIYGGNQQAYNAASIAGAANTSGMISGIASGALSGVGAAGGGYMSNPNFGK